MEIQSEKQGNAVVIRVTGRMDTLTAPEFETACVQWIDKGERVLLADFSDLEYISSAGLRTIMVVGKKLRVSGGKFGFCQLSSMVERVFSMSGFSAILPIYSTLEEALSKM